MRDTRVFLRTSARKRRGGMAEAEQQSRGLRFAEQLLLRHGWEQGKGLGRTESGRSEAIKVKVKCDKGGIGHREGEQFSFHWWDHVFNKASSSLQVEADQNRVTLRKTAEEEEGAISNKKPRKSLQSKDKLYGCFVKSATLLSGQELPEPKSKPAEEDSSSDEEEEQKLDLSSTTGLSDADLMKVCGGRTAHKGARHGLTMSAKLARLEQQEAEFLAQYRKNQHRGGSAADRVTEETRRSTDRHQDVNGDPQPKKKKKKRKDGAEGGREAADVLLPVEDGEERPAKKKKKKVEENEGGGDPSAAEEPGQKKKKKKRAQLDAEPERDDGEPRAEQEVSVTMTTDKKKKKKKWCESEK
ncbi:G patch domain-containing protein 4 [Cyprinodon tularosa]|uniref:G patch domain-containing protein 4 n=1 Tax=Cyprinodon tularosa TaxID=77115 RepID=UPI0018E21CC1|nr:G patch domain-containing protein 4 [Cyprinodon tularosa]